MWVLGLVHDNGLLRVLVGIPILIQILSHLDLVHLVAGGTGECTQPFWQHSCGACASNRGWKVFN
jgi:hypothetical protein